MIEPELLEVRAGYAVFRPQGRASTHQAMRMIGAALARAREQRIGRLLVALNRLDGVRAPSPARWSFFVREWARAARGSVSLEVVMRKDMIDLGTLGVTVAAHAGMRMAVHASEEEALAGMQRLDEAGLSSRSRRIPGDQA